MFQKPFWPSGAPNRKTAGTRRGRGFQRERHCPGNHKQLLFLGDVTVIPVKVHVTRTRNAPSSGKFGQWRGDAVCEKSKNTDSQRSENPEKTMFQILPCQWKVSLSETEDERASPLQNEGVDFEEKEVPVKLKKVGKASGSYHARHAVSEPVVGVAHPRVTRLSFSPCGIWLKPGSLLTEPQRWPDCFLDGNLL